MDKILEFHLDLSHTTNTQARVFEYDFNDYIKHISECIKNNDRSMTIDDISGGVGKTLPKEYKILGIRESNDRRFIFDIFNEFNGMIVRVFLEKL